MDSSKQYEDDSLFKEEEEELLLEKDSLSHFKLQSCIVLFNALVGAQGGRKKIKEFC